MMPNIYGRDYFLKYVELSKTTLSDQIHKCRCDLLKKHKYGGTVLDYGCGPGTFAKAAPPEFEVSGYDINPNCNEHGILVNPDIVTFWDSIEHIPNFYEVIKTLSPKFIYLTTPNLKSVKSGIQEWKHYRPKEHLFYFDEDSLTMIFKHLGYNVLEINYNEGRLRNSENPTAILTMAFKRED